MDFDNWVDRDYVCGCGDRNSDGDGDGDSDSDSGDDEDAVAEDIGDDEDDEIVCGFCNRADETPDDLILLCDGRGCDAAFHMYCVGELDGVPDGDWFCPSCAS